MIWHDMTLSANHCALSEGRVITFHFISLCCAHVSSYIFIFIFILPSYPSKRIHWSQLPLPLLYLYLYLFSTYEWQREILYCEKVLFTTRICIVPCPIWEWSHIPKVKWRSDRSCKIKLYKILMWTRLSVRLFCFMSCQRYNLISEKRRNLSSRFCFVIDAMQCSLVKVKRRKEKKRKETFKLEVKWSEVKWCDVMVLLEMTDTVLLLVLTLRNSCWVLEVINSSYFRFILFYFICVKTFFMVRVSALLYWALRFKADRSSSGLFKIAEEKEGEGTVMWMQSMRFFTSCEFSLMSCYVLSSPSLCYPLPLGDYSTLVHPNLSCLSLSICVCVSVCPCSFIYCSTKRTKILWLLWNFSHYVNE